MANPPYSNLVGDVCVDVETIYKDDTKHAMHTGPIPLKLGESLAVKIPKQIPNTKTKVTPVPCPK
jgi:hypothetical protein